MTEREFPTWRWVDQPTLVHRWRVRGSNDEWTEGSGTAITGMPVNATIEMETATLYPDSAGPWQHGASVITTAAAPPLDPESTTRRRRMRLLRRR